MALHIYIPEDRLRALARGEILPDRTSGAALFADISGFTPLTESLRESLGARRGAEELSKQLESVYSVLIAEVKKFGGSVISFAGDAMMCWFGGQSPASQAAASAFRMQRAIQAFPALGLKVAITFGDARRFVVGDPEIQRLDLLAGALVARTAMGEHLATKGDILVDEATASSLVDAVSIKEWRVDEAGERFAVVRRSEWHSDLWQQSDDQFEVTHMPDDQSNVRPFIHRAVYERETSGQGSFLTDFRPCVALFVRFTGIDYDLETAQSELDAFIRQVQNIAGRHQGTLLDITIGDKGSYAYVNFGALSTHEDDSRRAVRTALELMKASTLQLQMGITQGLMRVGAYGGETRKVFGALGDDVNLAARLMTAASVGEILLSSHVYKAVMGHFTIEPRPPLPMKGKVEPLPVFAVTGESQKRAVRLQEPNYSLPMVGRQDELQIINTKLELAREGKGEVIGIVAEAGLGKSRLVAEVIRSARRKGFVGFGGACQSDGIHTPYLAWKPIWQAFFDVDPDMPQRKLVRWLEGEIEDRAPDRIQAMPLLSAVLDLNIPENDFTRNLEPKVRQSALHALFEDCLKAAAKDAPVLIVIEDLHWVDALSHDLLEGLAKALDNHAVCFVLAYRPPQLERLQAPRLEALTQFTRIELQELTKAEAESAIRAKLLQLYPARSGALPSGLVDVLMGRAQGNPFYLEELLNYVRDRGLDPSDLHNIALPDSLHTLILSRIDQLSEQEKTALRAASIVGRLFRAAWLNGYYPELGSMPQVKVVLDQLDELDITPLDSEPELTYLFKHIVTHEVTYESLPFATRARLHEQLARYLENLGAPVDAIVFHYGRSENKEKQREYLRKAGEAAQKNFANEAALAYYGGLLPLLQDGKEQTQIHMQRGQVLQLMGKWDDAEADYRTALKLANGDVALKARAQFALGKLNRLRGDYEPALVWLAQSKEAYAVLQDSVALAQVFIETGAAFFRKGELEQARNLFNAGLALARSVNNRDDIASALIWLGGGVAQNLCDHTTAHMLLEESLAHFRETDNKAGAAASLINLGGVAYSQGDYASARTLYEESLALFREMGHKAGMSASLNSLGLIAYSQGSFAEAQALQEQSLALAREIGEKGHIALAFINMGFLAYAQNDYAAARALYEESLIVCKETDEPFVMAYALLGLGLVDLFEHSPEASSHILQSLRLRQESGEKLEQISSLIGVAGLALQEVNPLFAAQLLGAVDSARIVLSVVVEPELKHFHAQTLAAVCEQLDEAAFQSAWEEGTGWSLEEAVKKALEE